MPTNRELLERDIEIQRLANLIDDYVGPIRDWKGLAAWLRVHGYRQHPGAEHETEDRYAKGLQRQHATEMLHQRLLSEVTAPWVGKGDLVKRLPTGFQDNLWGWCLKMVEDIYAVDDYRGTPTLNGGDASADGPVRESAKHSPDVIVGDPLGFSEERMLAGEKSVEEGRHRPLTAVISDLKRRHGCGNTNGSPTPVTYTKDGVLYPTPENARCPKCGDEVFFPSMGEKEADPIMWCKDMGHWVGRLSECKRETPTQGGDAHEQRYDSTAQPADVTVGKGEAESADALAAIPTAVVQPVECQETPLPTPEPELPPAPENAHDEIERKCRGCPCCGADIEFDEDWNVVDWHDGFSTSADEPDALECRHMTAEERKTFNDVVNKRNRPLGQCLTLQAEAAALRARLRRYREVVENNKRLACDQMSDPLLDLDARGRWSRYADACYSILADFDAVDQEGK